MRNYLVTGAAGFIGFHVARRLLERGDRVVGVDSLNDYYDLKLKQSRLALLRAQSRFAFVQATIKDDDSVKRALANIAPATVIHLAGQAGVRYSIENPGAYVASNLVGFAKVLEACRETASPHLVYASSSSVYGASRKVPYSEREPASHPVSLYAATKRANELMAHSYSQLFGLPTTGLRFFTVYGPWGRPDMALFSFTKAILAGEPIVLYRNGDMRRDFTFIDDVVEAVSRIADSPSAPNPNWNAKSPDPATSSAPFRVYNVGASQPVVVSEMVDALEAALGKKAIRRAQPQALGDVLETWSDSSDLAERIGYRPQTTLAEGIRRFVEWYREYYGEAI